MNEKQFLIKVTNIVKLGSSERGKVYFFSDILCEDMRQRGKERGDEIPSSIIIIAIHFLSSLSSPHQKQIIVVSLSTEKRFWKWFVLGQHLWTQFTLKIKISGNKQ